MEKELVSVVITNWNGLHFLKDCLSSLESIQTRYTIEIIIVDNASSDNSKIWIDKLQSRWKIKLISNNANLGYAEGNNIGFNHSEGEFILFLNNDTKVSPDFLDPLIHSLQKSPLRAGIQPTIMQLPKRHLIDSVGSYFTYSGFLYHYGHNKTNSKMYQKASKIFSMKGACMLFRKSALDRIGLFDKEYFAYFEETDLCIRALLAGFELWYEPNSVIYHKGGGTSSEIQPGLILMHSYKNRLRTYLKNFQISTLITLLPIHLGLLVIVSLAYLCMLKIPQSLAVVNAVVWNIAHLPSIWKERKKINKIRKISDKEYLPIVSRSIRLSYFYHLFVTSLAGYTDHDEH